MNKIRPFLAPLMALLGVISGVVAVIGWPQFNIAFAFIAIQSLLLAIYLQQEDK